MDFFTDKGGIPFYIFGKLYFFLILIVFISIFLIFKYRKKLRKFVEKKNIDKIIRYIMASILFLNMTIYYLSKILIGIYDYKIDLPLHFCFITGYLFMFLLVKNNKKLYRVIYFFTFVGPIPAIFLPDLKFSYDRIVFWQFIISHHVMLIFSVFTLVVLKYKVEKKDILKAFLYGNILAIVMYIFNKIFNTNYMMMNILPNHIYELFPFVKYGFPIIWLEICSIIALTIAYIPVFILNKLDNKEIAN